MSFLYQQKSKQSSKNERNIIKFCMDNICNVGLMVELCLTKLHERCSWLCVSVCQGKTNIKIGVGFEP